MSIVLLVFGAGVFADRAAPTPLTVHAQVYDVGYFTDPVEYYELRFDDGSSVVVVGSPDVPIVQYLGQAEARRVTLALITE